jgi:AcrR family transcriptional regulator
MTLGHKTANPRATPLRARAGRRERRKADIRSRLFRAALQRFASRGFTATTVEDITQAADVAKGTFFNYFPTKEHLLTALGEFRLEVLRAAHSEVQNGTKTVRAALRDLLLALPVPPWESRTMARCLLSGGLSGEPVSSLAAKTMTEGRRILRSMIALGQRRGEIRSDWRSDETAGLFQQLFFGTMYRWTLDPHLNLTRCLSVTFDLFWAGVEARPEQLRDQLQKSRKRTS